MNVGDFFWRSICIDPNRILNLIESGIYVFVDTQEASDVEFAGRFDLQ